MSRSIKFRVWDKEDSCFIEYSNADPQIAADGTVYCYKRTSEGDVQTNEKHLNEIIVIEQFTGLKDGHGKDIYEGDIVKWSHGPGVSDVGVVEYRTHDDFGGHPMAAFYGLSVSRFAGLCQFQSDDRYEVVGNIHETPELLKK